MAQRDDDDYLSRVDDHTAFTTMHGQPIDKVDGVDVDRTAEEVQEQHLDSKMAHAEHNPLQEREATHEYDPNVRTATAMIVASLLPPELLATAAVAQAASNSREPNARGAGAEERVDVATAEKYNEKPPEYVAEQLNEMREEYAQERGTLPSPNTPQRGVDRNAGMAMA